MSGCSAPDQARNVAAACGIEWFCGSFAERYGTTMDAIVQQDGQEAACRSCRVLKKDLIGEIAEAHGVTRCAFPTTVDDNAGAFFSSLLSGTIECTLFSSGTTGKKRIPVIRPFMEIPAPEVIRYAELHPECDGCGTLPPCPCHGSGSRLADARVALDTYDRRHPATKFALANLAGTLAGISAAQGLPASCPVCGEPISGGKCETCSIRRNIERRIVS
jgi:tRNA(Ile)-lysidine synthase TilS/MesJ